MKVNDQRKIKKKKKKRKVSKVRRRKKNKPIENPPLPSQIEEQVVVTKEVPPLKTLHIFEPWIKRDEFDVRIFVQF